MAAAGTEVLSELLVCGLLGFAGHGVRAVAGLKKMNDDAAQNSGSAADLFVASRLVVSLMIGFISGILAGLSLNLKTIFVGDGLPNTQTLLGVVAAGYAGTDFIESIAPSIVSRLAPGKAASKQTPDAAFVPAGAIDAKYGVIFGSLVAGGFFSSNPDDMTVVRSIRTNNPGALNFSGWQKGRLGYVGVTQPDNSTNHNVTTIYRTPEHGAAAWYHLLAVLYAFPGGTFTLQALAARYAGGDASPGAIQAYIKGWTRWYTTPITPTASLSVSDDSAMLNLAKAMFSHEAGRTTPLKDDQIIFAIQRERVGTLPA